MKRILLIILVLSLAAGAVLLVKKRSRELSRLPLPERPPVSVHTHEIVRGNLSVIRHYSGTVEAEQSVALSPRIHGEIRDVAGQEGERFSRGETLVRLDAREIRQESDAMEAEIERARSELWILKASFDRNKALWERRNIAKQTFDEAQAAYSQARHRVESLEEQKARIRTRLRYTVLKAPFDGVVTVRHQEPGDMAAPGLAVLELENPDAGYKVIVRVPTRILDRVGPGTEAVLDHDDDRLAAAVSRILPAVEAGTSLAVLEIDVESPPFGLPSGSVVGVDLIVARTDGLIVPARSLLRQQDSSHVFVLDAGGRVRPVQVEVLGRSNDRAAVSGDLEAGDRVVTADESLLLGLAPGQEVRPVGESAL